MTTLWLVTEFKLSLRAKQQAYYSENTQTLNKLHTFSKTFIFFYTLKNTMSAEEIK